MTSSALVWCGDALVVFVCERYPLRKIMIGYGFLLIGIGALDNFLLSESIFECNDLLYTVMLTSDIYGGMHRLVSRVTSLFDINVVFIPTWDLDAVRKAFEENDRVRMVHMETPSNPLMRITDIRALADICHQHDCYLSVDSTMMSPYLQQPLNHGADIVVHSMTKFFGGHSDTMGGVVAVAMESVAKKIAFFQNAEGTGLAPFDCWLFLRGIKTLAIRVERAQQNAIDVANFLHRQPLVKDLYYAGLEPKQHEMLSNKQAAKAFKIHMGQAKGGGSVLSFTTGSAELSRRIIDALRLFKLTVSFGSCNSLCEMPAYLSHASIPSEERTLPEDLIRLSIGIEDVNDLIEDLGHAFRLAKSENFAEEMQELKRDPPNLHRIRTKPELPDPEQKFNDVHGVPRNGGRRSQADPIREVGPITTDLVSAGLVFLVGGLTGVMSAVVLLLRKK